MFKNLKDLLPKMEKQEMIEITKWKAINKNSLVAIFDVKIQKWGGFMIREMTLFQKDSQKWIGFPSKVYEKDNEKKYFAFNMFETKEMALKFQEKVLEAIESSPLTKVQEQTKEPELIQGDMPF